jgi:hypothetical protein
VKISDDVIPSLEYIYNALEINKMLQFDEREYYRKRILDVIAIVAEYKDYP